MQSTTESPPYYEDDESSSSEDEEDSLQYPSQVFSFSRVLGMMGNGDNDDNNSNTIHNDSIGSNGNGSHSRVENIGAQPSVHSSGPANEKGNSDPEIDHDDPGKVHGSQQLQQEVKSATTGSSPASSMMMNNHSAGTIAGNSSDSSLLMRKRGRSTLNSLSTSNNESALDLNNNNNNKRRTRECIICGKPASSKNYSTRLHVRDYMDCFPHYQGEIGFVCGTCYNKCYLFRTQKILPTSATTDTPQMIPPHSTSRITTTTTTTTTTTSTGYTSDETILKKNTSTSGVAVPSIDSASSSLVQSNTNSYTECSSHSSSSGSTTTTSATTATPTSISTSLIDNIPQEYCACCCSNLLSRTYLYSTYAVEYRHLYPDIRIVTPGNTLVCEKCFRRAKALHLGSTRRTNLLPKQQQQQQQQQLQYRNQLQSDEDDGAATNNITKEKESPIVNIFIDFRVLSSSSNGQNGDFTVSIPNIVRCCITSTVTLSDMKAKIEKITELQNQPIQDLRRIVRDYTGAELHENLWRDNIFEQYPLKDDERIVAFLYSNMN